MFGKKASEWKNRAYEQREAKNQAFRQIAELKTTNLELTSKLEAESRERQLVERLIGRIVEQNSALLTRLTEKQDFDYGLVIREIAQSLSLVINGPGLAAAEKSVTTEARITDPFAELDALAGIKPGMIPVHEYDPLKPQNNDEMSVGEWNAHTPLIPSQVNPNQMEHHLNTLTGQMERVDYQPMFRPGQTAPPPAGGLE